MDKLLPCPFCGKQNISEQFAVSGHGDTSKHMGCFNCGARGPSDYGRDHKAAWNTRAPSGTVAVERGLAKVALAALESMMGYKNAGLLEDALADKGE